MKHHANRNPSMAEKISKEIDKPLKRPHHQKLKIYIMLFIINDIEAKAKECTEILEEKFYPWFAKHFVSKRIRMEPNFHELYINFLDKCSSKHLIKEIVQETCENCKVLLKSELSKSNAAERRLLKNFGSWLGKVTIGKNNVLVDQNSLILEAYGKCMMSVVIPFMSKILESCKSSIAYQPPNPWTMAILELLAEIHAMPNLKASLKFEIEVLFKNLDVDMKAVTPTSLLKDRGRIIEGNPDFSQQLIVKEDYPIVKAAINPADLPPEAAAGPSYQGGPRILYQLPAPASNTPEFHIFYLNTHFQRIFPMAMDKAIEGIVSTMVKRTVFIATQTTMELVLKEYITKPDENFIHSTSCMLIVCLAGNLSYITCKEPLRSSMSTELRNTCMNFLNLPCNVLLLKVGTIDL